ncbi:MAG: GGDEF domain-containing protein [Candidatus Marinimicrobia bacterium]|nr:GGDEF domain-containing protein [Candidatus Neomarinimicrobiota bacterium]MDD5582204.1 GGDEF domain-containing protein [Candidatus Neomarinimicrobiota bacterium]
MKKAGFGILSVIWVLGFFIWVLPLSDNSVWLKSARVALWILLGLSIYLLYSMSKKASHQDEEESFGVYLEKLNSANTEEDILKILRNMLSSSFLYDKLTVCLLNPQVPTVLRVIYTDGMIDSPKVDDNLSIKEGLWAYLFKQKESLVLNRYREKAPFEYRLTPGDFHYTLYNSLMGLCLQFETLKGIVITLESYNPAEYSQKYLDTFHQICLNFALAYHRLTTLDMLNHYATVDGLTGVFNHRAFKEKLFEEVYRARRYDQPLTLLMMDLDNFKKINDTYGHLYGDYILRIVADIIKNNVRMVDIVARYGGEEFTVILANAEKEAVKGTAERIRQKISEYPFEQDGIRETITVSIGMASFPEDSKDGISLIQAADNAMYKAKRSGKNRVEIYQ